MPQFRSKGKGIARKVYPLKKSTLLSTLKISSPQYKLSNATTSRIVEDLLGGEGVQHFWMRRTFAKYDDALKELRKTEIVMEQLGVSEDDYFLEVGSLKYVSGKDRYAVYVNFASEPSVIRFDKLANDWLNTYSGLKRK